MLFIFNIVECISIRVCCINMHLCVPQCSCGSQNNFTKPILPTLYQIRGSNSRVRFVPLQLLTYRLSVGVVLVYVLFCWDKVSLYSPGCPGTCCVDQAGLKLRNQPASASQVLGSKMCATTAPQKKHLHSCVYFYLHECRGGAYTESVGALQRIKSSLLLFWKT